MLLFRWFPCYVFDRLNICLFVSIITQGRKVICRILRGQCRRWGNEIQESRRTLKWSQVRYIMRSGRTKAWHAGHLTNSLTAYFHTCCFIMSIIMLLLWGIGSYIRRLQRGRYEKNKIWVVSGTYVCLLLFRYYAISVIFVQIKTEMRKKARVIISCTLSCCMNVSTKVFID